jgi:hypothetical protein
VAEGHVRGKLVISVGAVSAGTRAAQQAAV